MGVLSLREPPRTGEDGCERHLQQVARGTSSCCHGYYSVSRMWLFSVVFLCLIQGMAGVIITEDGETFLCGTSPEMSAMRTTEMIAGGSDMLHQVSREPCNKRNRAQRRFRTYDGTCNTELDRGAAFSYAKRMMAPKYQAPGPSGPRVYGARSGKKLRSARTISRQVHRPKVTKTIFTLLLMQFGQVLDHDLTIVPLATETNNSIRCCGVPASHKYHDCFEIEVEDGDPMFSKCMEFIRSDPITLVDGTVPEPRTHINAITAFVDASMVYGSDRLRVKNLRSMNGTGPLLKTKLYKNKERLPEGSEEDCINLSHKHFCAMAGDGRVNEQPGLTAMHTVFHLEHNRMVRKLARVILYRRGYAYGPEEVEEFLQTSPLDLQERIYHVVRKALGAVWQNIVYSEYLPLIIGPKMMTKYKLWSGRRSHFDKNVDPSISIEFLTAAFRFGHTLVNDMLITDGKHQLRKLFSTSSHNLEYYENIIKGLVSPSNNAETYDPHLAPSLTNHLFENNKMGLPGLDLAALNIQRGRDHGMPTHNELRKYLGLKKYSWDDFGEFASTLKKVYDHVDDIECFPGGTCEPPIEGGVVGELFAHVIGQQFHDLKYGDRFFYETDSLYYGFTNDQLRTLTKLCMSKILCENANMGTIQINPFKKPHRSRNAEYKCSDYPDINMWHFSHEFV